MPFFSIVIPTYNRPAELKRAIDSVLRQSFTDYEVIVVNNGETPIENIYNSNKISILREEKKGGNYARNRGIAEAKSDFICFLDDDDEYLENHLQAMYDLIKSKNFEIAFYRTFAQREIKPGVFVDQKDPIKPESMHILHYSFLYTIFMSSVCVHKEILKKHKFNPTVKVGQDYDLWIRIMVEYKSFISNIATTIYHLSEDSVSRPTKEKYYYYIKLYKSYFDNPKYGQFLPKSLKSDRIFKYYYWILCEFKKELGLLEFFQVIGKMIFYKPSVLFGKDLYSALLK